MGVYRFLKNTVSQQLLYQLPRFPSFKTHLFTRFKKIRKVVQIKQI